MRHQAEVFDAELQAVLEVVDRMAARMNATFVRNDADIDNFQRSSEYFTAVEVVNEHDREPVRRRA